MKIMPFTHYVAFIATHIVLFSWALGGVAPTAQQRETLLRAVKSDAQWFPWWEPDGSRRGTNAVLEKAFGWGAGDAVRALERLLKEELAEPEGGDPGAVARVLDAIRLSGDMSVTNTLDGLLFSDAVPFRPELFCARASFCGLETGAFALRFVGALAAEIGPPLQPDRDRFWTELFEPPWDDGHPPAGYMEGVRKWRNARFAQDYGMTESEVVRMLERIYLEGLEKKDTSEQSVEFLRFVLGAIVQSNYSSSTNMLARALTSDWNPFRFNVFQNYLHDAGLDGLPICLNVLSDLPKFSAFTRGSCYHLIAELAKDPNMSEDTLA